MAPVGTILRLFPGPPEELEAEDVYAELIPRASAGDREEPLVAINMVSTLDGRASIGGKASPISSGADRAIMRNIRSAFDAVVVGAGTVRAEEMNLGVPEYLSERRKARGLPGQPLGVVLAGSGELPLGRKVFRPPEEQEILLVAGGSTPEPELEKAAELGVRALRAKSPGLPEPAEILALLANFLPTVNAVLLEGGPTVNRAFLSASKADELFLTLSPKLSVSGAHAPPIIAPATGAEPATADLELTSVYSSGRSGELFLRYLRKDSTPEAPTSFR